MVNTIVNVLIAGIVGAVAFIAVRALVIGSGQLPCGDPLAVSNNTANVTRLITGDCGFVVCPYNATAQANITNCTYGATTNISMNTTVDSGIECWTAAECTMFVTIIPLAIAITVVVALFLGLTKMRGV